MFINFSDAAKFADIARNIISGFGFNSGFSFWSSKIWTPPVTPYSMAVFFKIFGISDFSAVATSFFYFILTLIFVYILGKKIFKSKLVGALSTLAVGFNYDLIHYATNGASESPFIFEIVAASYFASLKKKWSNVVCLILLILMYFTRPQAFIYIAGIALYWLLINFKTRKALIYFVGVMTIGFLVDRFVLPPLSGKYFLYSVTGKALATSFDQSSVASDMLRGVPDYAGGGIIQTFKNVLYNLYNFYKLLPQIISPYLFAIFVLGLFIPSSPKATGWSGELQRAFKIASVFMVMVTLLVTAASIPFFRYIHPIIPLVYIIAVGTLVELISKFYILNSKFVILVSTFLFLVFGVGQTLGILLLDSRFERNTHNVGKPPVYVELSKILKENTNPNQIVVTNLDTWGSWYGERKTVWFPVEPKQLIDPANGKIPFDAIYLTSYLIDDENYYMGTEWRIIFNNPSDSSKWICDGCVEIAKEFTLKGVYTVPSLDDYEKQDARAILLIRK
jgi:4-amino-4-deoxy-L-arabinose transferase-like glycosyltransferase